MIYEGMDDLEGEMTTTGPFQSPCSVWTRSNENYLYLYRLFCELRDEYTHRYGKIHETDIKLGQNWTLPVNIPYKPFTEPPNDASYCKRKDVIDAYRILYK